MSKPRLAIQLYTVRDQLAEDFVGTLRKVRDTGYSHVELAGYGPHKAAELKRILDDEGLTACSDHCPIDQLEANINRVIDNAGALEVGYVVCPYLPEDRRTDEAAWRACAQSLEKAGDALETCGIQLCYHNHSFEFVRVGDRYALDLLYDETTPAHLQAELDTYWVKHGGEDPIDYIKRLSRRCPILHLKDMADDADRSFAEVGEGILDFPAILAAAEKTGTIWAIVEQDVCPGDPFVSIATSLANLAKMGYG